MLLVVGLSFIAGGMATRAPQLFDRRVTSADIGVLLVSVIAVVLPTIAASAPGGSERDTLADSRSTAVVLLLMYAAFLVFTLSPERPPKEQEEGAPLLADKVAAEDAPLSSAGAEEPPEQPSMSFWTILGLLGMVTVIMAVLSNALVLNVFPVSDALNITPDLVSCIALPIIGNIAEASTAIIAARRGSMDLSLAVALGSSTQISLFLLPLACLLGWAIDVPFSFDFAPTFATAFFASVVVVGLVVMVCVMLRIASVLPVLTRAPPAAGRRGQLAEGLHVVRHVRHLRGGPADQRRRGGRRRPCIRALGGAVRLTGSARWPAGDAYTCRINRHTRFTVRCGAVTRLRLTRRDATALRAVFFAGVVAAPRARRRARRRCSAGAWRGWWCSSQPWPAPQQGNRMPLLSAVHHQPRRTRSCCALPRRRARCTGELTRSASHALGHRRWRRRSASRACAWTHHRLSTPERLAHVPTVRLTSWTCCATPPTRRACG
jgi:calcium/proton exchanger cax